VCPNLELPATTISRRAARVARVARSISTGNRVPFDDTPWTDPFQAAHASPPA